MWQGRDFLLEQIGTIRWGEGKGGKKKKKEMKIEKKIRGVRSSSLSLDFTEIGPSVFVGASDKVLLRDESFAWVQESGVLAKPREVGFFSYSVLFLV